MKFTKAATSTDEAPKSPTPDEVDHAVAELSKEIVQLVRNYVAQRFVTPPGELPVAEQVALAALSAAEGIMAIEALHAGIPPDRVCKIHDTVFTAVLKSAASGLAAEKSG